MEIYKSIFKDFGISVGFPDILPASSFIFNEAEVKHFLENGIAQWNQWNHGGWNIGYRCFYTNIQVH